MFAGRHRLAQRRLQPQIDAQRKQELDKMLGTHPDFRDVLTGRIKLFVEKVDKSPKFPHVPGAEIPWQGRVEVTRRKYGNDPPHVSVWNAAILLPGEKADSLMPMISLPAFPSPHSKQPKDTVYVDIRSISKALETAAKDDVWLFKDCEGNAEGMLKKATWQLSNKAGGPTIILTFLMEDKPSSKTLEPRAVPNAFIF